MIAQYLFFKPYLRDQFSHSQHLYKYTVFPQFFVLARQLHGTILLWFTVHLYSTFLCPIVFTYRILFIDSFKCDFILFKILHLAQIRVDLAHGMLVAWRYLLYIYTVFSILFIISPLYLHDHSTTYCRSQSKTRYNTHIATEQYGDRGASLIRLSPKKTGKI